LGIIILSFRSHAAYFRSAVKGHDEKRPWYQMEKFKDKVIGINLKHLYRRHIREAHLYRRHDDLFAEEQLAHGRLGLVLTHDVIGHRDKITTATIER
jgi:hypothetical protein